MKIIDRMRNLSASMQIEERRVLRIAFNALIVSRDNEKNADAILARINELNMAEDERYDAEQAK